MDLCTLTAELTIRGLTPTVADGKLAIAGPIERLTPALKSGLAEHRETLRKMLTPAADKKPSQSFDTVIPPEVSQGIEQPTADDQRKMFAAAWQRANKNPGGKGTKNRIGEVVCNPANNSTQEAAERFGVSPRSIHQAVAVLDHGCKQLQQAVRDGRVNSETTVSEPPPENADGIPDIAYADTPAADAGLRQVGDYFERLAADVLKRNPKQAANLTADPRGKPCRRCGFEPAVLTLLHQGGSVRRDCATCGAFAEFTTWHDADAAAKAMAEARAEFVAEVAECKSEASTPF